MNVNIAPRLANDHRLCADRSIYNGQGAAVVVGGDEGIHLNSGTLRGFHGHFAGVGLDGQALLLLDLGIDEGQIARFHDFEHGALNCSTCNRQCMTVAVDGDGLVNGDRRLRCKVNGNIRTQFDLAACLNHCDKFSGGRDLTRRRQERLRFRQCADQLAAGAVAALAVGVFLRTRSQIDWKNAKEHHQGQQDAHAFFPDLSVFHLVCFPFLLMIYKQR